MTRKQPESYLAARRFSDFQSLGILDAPPLILPGRSTSNREHGRTARRGINRIIAFGADTFRRDIMLPRLIPVGPEEIEDCSLAGRTHVLARLAKALRGERARGRAGHWTYSLDRHIGLLQAFKAERAALRKICATKECAVIPA